MNKLLIYFISNLFARCFCFFFYIKNIFFGFVHLKKFSQTFNNPKYTENYYILFYRKCCIIIMWGSCNHNQYNNNNNSNMYRADLLRDIQYKYMYKHSTHIQFFFRKNTRCIIWVFDQKKTYKTTQHLKYLHMFFILGIVCCEVTFG